MELKLRISQKEASEVCRKAIKEHAIKLGCDPDKEILVSRWYLRMTRNYMTFIGQESKEYEMTRIRQEKQEAAEAKEAQRANQFPREDAAPPEEKPVVEESNGSIENEPTDTGTVSEKTEEPEGISDSVPTPV